MAMGGMAEVFRARLAGQDPQYAKIIALKRVLPSLCQDKEFIKLFEREIGMAMGLAHPNLVTIYDFGAVNNQYYLAMEYVHGKSLNVLVSECLAKKVPLPIEFVCYVGREVCNALAYAHSLSDQVTGKFVGIIHRDISPHNVMLSFTGHVKLFDFGVAKMASRDGSTSGIVKGKPAYLSPEQALGEEVDGRTDIFSLGIVLWELLTGERLFWAEKPLLAIQSVVEKEILPPSTYNPAVPPALDAIVMQALQRDIYQRYLLAQDLGNDLNRTLASLRPDYKEAHASAFVRTIFGELVERENHELISKLQVAGASEPVVVPDYGFTAAPEERSQGIKRPPPPAEKPKEDYFQITVVALCLIGFGMWIQSWMTRLAAPDVPAVQARAIASEPVTKPPSPESLNTGRSLCGADSPKVCAILNGEISTYANLCEAESARADLLYQGKCDRSLNPQASFHEIRPKDEGWLKAPDGAPATTFGSTLEVVVDIAKYPSILRLQLALVSGGKDHAVRDVTSPKVLIPLTAQLPGGTYSLQLRGMDRQGNMFFIKYSEITFYLGNSLELRGKPR